MNAAKAQAHLLPEAGVPQTLAAGGGRSMFDRGLGRLDPLKPLFERLRYCHVPRRNEPFVS
jgi:hypothetical protein